MGFSKEFGRALNGVLATIDAWHFWPAFAVYTILLFSLHRLRVSLLFLTCLSSAVYLGLRHQQMMDDGIVPHQKTG